MPCSHRFLGKHINGNLFPNWPVKHLFVGTFNPEWDRIGASNALYFYGRSTYFWELVKVFFNGNVPIDLTTEDAMVAFCQKNLIGFTDLILSIEDADAESEIHQKLIGTVEDNDLKKFKDIKWNRNNIIEFVKQNPNVNLYFTLLDDEIHSIFNIEMLWIEDELKKLNLSKPKRLYSPTGRGRYKGSPRLHKLVHLWSEGSNLPSVDLKLFPLSEAVNRSNSKAIQKFNNVTEKGIISIEIENLYRLTINENKSSKMHRLFDDQEVKVSPTLKNEIIPEIRIRYGHTIDLNSKTGKQTPKNTQTLAQEVADFYLTFQLSLVKNDSRP